MAIINKFCCLHLFIYFFIDDNFLYFVSLTQGGVCNVNLTAYSTFTRSMNIKSIQADHVCIHLDETQEIDTENNDDDEEIEIQDFDECHLTNLSRSVDSINSNGLSSQIVYEDDEKPQIAANSESYIDQLQIFIPKICDESCAITTTIDLDAVVINNQKRFNMLKRKINRFRALYEKYQKLAFHVQTNHIKRYDFNGSIDIIWQKLVKGPIEFPIAQIGHELYKEFDVVNPMNETIEISYQLHNADEFDIDVTQLPSETIDECWNCVLTTDPVFRLEIPKEESHVISIPAKSTYKIAVKFSAENPGTYGTLLYIHNNFTVLETVWLTAKSVVPQFKFGNRKPGSKTPLLFELTDKHLRDCNHPNINMRSVTAKRTFTAKNSGEVPIYLHELRIDGLPCEGYGYRILDCAPFELPPNGSKKIEISFTPDFTLAMVKKTLYLDTSLNYSVNYTLLSMIAPLSLGVCSKALARPEWESMMKNVTAVVLAVSFICVLFAAYLDSMKVLKVHVENMSKAKGSLQPALDLRQIGLKCLFTDDNNTKTVSSTNTVNNTIASQLSSVTKQQNLAATSMCNGKSSNGSVNKRKSNDKDNNKKRSTGSITETGATKKSWASEIAKKFTSGKKSDLKSKTDVSVSPISSSTSSLASNKSKNTSSSSSSSSSCSSSTQLMAISTCKQSKTMQKTKDDVQNVNFEEEEGETSSTTTESSYHSDDKSPNIKTKSKKSSQLKDLCNVTAQSKQTNKKTIVKKSKSLPLSYESPDIEANTLTVPSYVGDPHDTEQMDNNNFSGRNSLTLTNVIDNDSSKCTNSSEDYVPHSTPPNKSNALKLMNGKTPGRERNKIGESIPYRKLNDFNDCNSTSAFKSTAFEFSSPLASESRINGNHPWLDLVEKHSSNTQKNTVDLNQTKPIQTSNINDIFDMKTNPSKSNQNKFNSKQQQSQGLNKMKNDIKSKQSDRNKNTKSKQSMAKDDGAFSSHASFENLSSYESNDKLTAPGIDLGPIGTRKSPSSTPVWEPMHSIHTPIPLNLSNNNSNGNLLNNFEGSSNSFFTGVFPRSSTYQRTNTPNTSFNDMLVAQRHMKTSDQLNSLRQQLQNAETLRFMDNMYRNQDLDQPKPNSWDSTNLMSLIQQQQKQKQQQRQQQQQV